MAKHHNKTLRVQAKLKKMAVRNYTATYFILDNKICRMIFHKKMKDTGDPIELKDFKEGDYYMQTIVGASVLGASVYRFDRDSIFSWILTEPAVESRIKEAYNNIHSENPKDLEHFILVEAFEEVVIVENNETAEEKLQAFEAVCKRMEAQTMLAGIMMKKLEEAMDKARVKKKLDPFWDVIVGREVS